MLPSSIDLKRYGVIGVDAKARAGKYRLRKLCPSSALKLCPNLCLPANPINYDRERHDSPEALAGYGFGGSLSSSVVSGRIPSKLLILHPPASLQAGGRRFESCTAHQLSDCFQT